MDNVCFKKIYCIDNLDFKIYSNNMGKSFKKSEKGGGKVSIEIIKVIKEAEEKAETIKKDAAQQAKQIITNTNAQAQEIIDKAHESAEASSSNVIKEAEAEGQKLYDEIIKKASIECESILQNASSNLDDAATIILERIVKASGNS